MILYHGTNSDFSQINLGKTKPYKDFGKGFYVTDIQHQAFELAKNRCRIWGGSPVVQEYEFDESVLQSGSLKILRFEKVQFESFSRIHRTKKA